MEQRRGSSNKKEDRIEEEQVGFPVHNQVKKIKQESYNKILDWSPGQTEIRPVLKEITTTTRHRISRSPLGLAGRPISVGDS